MYIINALSGLTNAARKGDKMLESYDGKLSRTVLRRERGSNPSDLVDNLLTSDPKVEMLITIISLLAEEESRSISENIRWGQRKRFADGKVSVLIQIF